MLKEKLRGWKFLEGKILAVLAALRARVK